MITAFYTEINGLPDKAAFDQKLSLLPDSMRDKILSYHSPHEQLLRLCGKLLFLKMLSVYDQTTHSPDQIKYNEWGKPYFNDNIDINISHSGNIVICAGVTGSMTGVDVEQHKGIDINEMREHFTDNEWNRIICSEDRNTTFYKMWVRKEACLKAIGKGSFKPLVEVDVCTDEVFIDNKKWYLQDVVIKKGYSACIATSKPDNITLEEINMNTLINNEL